MSDNTTLNNGSGGDVLRTEDIAGIKMPVSKIHTGADGVDGGSVTAANPLAVVHVSGSVTGLQQGGQAVSSANPLVTVSISGSATGLLHGGQPVSQANPLSVSGALGILVAGSQASLSNPLPVNVNLQGTGQILSGSAAKTVAYSFGDFVTSGSVAANQVIAPQGASVRIRVLSLNLMAGVAVNVQFQGTGSAGVTSNISGRYFIPSSGGFVLPFNPHGWFQTGLNEGLNVALSGPTDLGINVTWVPVGA